MKKFSFLYLLAIMLFASSCESELLNQEIKKPILPEGKASIIITGDDMATTRSTSGRVEFTGGYATGAGLYDGKATATVEAVPYDGYQLASFIGGPVDGNSSQFSGSDTYSFKIQDQDWQFSVSFKKEYKVTVNAGSGGTVSGGGTVLDGENCTVRATSNSGYSFEGWYEGNTKVSSSAYYTFTVSSNRT